MDDAVGTAVRILDDIRDATAPSTYWPTRGRLFDVSFEGAQSRTVLGKDVIARIAALNERQLPVSLAETLAVVSERARLWVLAEDWYWTVFDPSGEEIFTMFAPTAYGGGWVVGNAVTSLRRASLETATDRARYLAALHELGDQIDALATRTRGQTERGIYMPRAQAEAAVVLLERLAVAHADAVIPDDARSGTSASFNYEVRQVAAARIGAGFSSWRACLDPTYFNHTRDNVGLMHYPNGAEIYAALVRHHGSTDLTPTQVHELGLKRMASIRAGMAKARHDAEFDGDDYDYRAALDADPAWRARSAEEIAHVFDRYIERFRPHVSRLFNFLPNADYGVRPLPDAMSRSMTFGYYDAPSENNPRGDYVFNARNIANSSMCTIASLNYHELVPGHHFHLALQYADTSLPAMRRWCMPTSFVEGWAEYAVTLAEENGMFEVPAERFGRCVNEAFLASRLVVDTGMNAMGWSLERARDYMRENSFFPETEIRSETLRYAADIPGQALAYKLGDHAIMTMREEMREQLGARFDIRDFHDAVLGGGAMPLGLLKERVERRTAELLVAAP